MCGIAGVVGLTDGRDARAVVERMSRQIVHRGPDDHGVWHEGRNAFAVRRLSIIDLAGGHQPMVAPTGAVLAFNGEIYNYRALRDELADEWRFTTQSDTEVVLALVTRRGIEAIDALEGMFAFAYLDDSRKRLHLVRDRLGKKPLYYTEPTGPLYFASELKAILAGLPTRPALDQQALDDYLTLRYIPVPETPWQGLRKLAAGERLAIDLENGNQSLVKWWELRVRSSDRDAPDAPAEFERLFLAAVEKRLVAADVPVGVLLSGGLDSSAVSAAAVELGHQEFHTFSVAFAEGGEYSELPFAREMASHIGSRHHEVTIDRAAFMRALPDLVWQTDEPLADLTAIPLHAVSRLAREHVKVVLSGEGSDELLAGYDLEVLAARERSHRVRRFAARAVRRRPPHMTWVFDDAAKAALWRPGFDGLRPTEELLRSWYAAGDSPYLVDRVQDVYCRSWLPEDLLMKADKATMAASLELRTPFLDHLFVEWASKLPLEWKVGSSAVGWRSKRILREFAAARLPAAIIDRPKQGFPVPAYRWLADGLASTLDARLLGNTSRVLQLMQPGPIREVLNLATRGNEQAAHRVWSLVVLDYWLERWT
jgi:asparagine synthase (glutamine-hydrolysing)